MGSIELKQVRKDFGEVKVINDVSLKIDDGQFAIAEDKCANQILPADETCSIQLTWPQEHPGEPATAWRPRRPREGSAMIPVPAA